MKVTIVLIKKYETEFAYIFVSERQNKSELLCLSKH